MGGAGNFTCSEGHIGALCEACDLYGSYWNKSYSNSGAYVCGECSSPTTNILIIVALSIFSLVTYIII